MDIVATHAYDENPGDKVKPLPLAKQHGKRIWMTEVSYFGDNDPTIKDGLQWAKLMHDHLTVSEVNAWFYWWGACYKPNGESLIPLDVKNRTYSTTKRLFTFSNFSRFIRPGFVRLDCPSEPEPGVNVSAFRTATAARWSLSPSTAAMPRRKSSIASKVARSTSFTPYPHLRHGRSRALGKRSILESRASRTKRDHLRRIAGETHRESPLTLSS